MKDFVCAARPNIKLSLNKTHRLGFMELDGDFYFLNESANNFGQGRYYSNCGYRY